MGRLARVRTAGPVGAFRRARRQDAWRLVPGLGEHAGGDQPVDDGIDAVRRCQQQARQHATRRRRRAGEMALGDIPHYRQPQALDLARRGGRLVGFAAHAFGVGNVEAQLTAHHQDQPADIKPDQQEDDDGEAGIDSVVVARGGDEGRKGHARRPTPILSGQCLPDDGEGVLCAAGPRTATDCILATSSPQLLFIESKEPVSIVRIFAQRILFPRQVWTAKQIPTR